jgi:hypothetical protein
VARLHTSATKRLRFSLKPDKGPAAVVAGLSGRKSQRAADGGALTLHSFFSQHSFIVNSPETS